MDRKKVRKRPFSPTHCFHVSPGICRRFWPEVLTQTPKNVVFRPRSYSKGPNHALEKVLTKETPCIRQKTLHQKPLRARTLAPMYFAIPDGRPSSTCIATAAAVTSALVVPFALKKRAQLHQRTLRNRILSWLCALRFQEGRRASPTSFATAVVSALVVPLSPDQEDPASRGDTASSDCVETLWSAIPRGRASPADFATAVAASSVMSSSPGQGDPPEGTVL